jgi:hypothetical protein
LEDPYHYPHDPEHGEYPGDTPVTPFPDEDKQNPPATSGPKETTGAPEGLGKAKRPKVTIDFNMETSLGVDCCSISSQLRDVVVREKVDATTSASSAVDDGLEEEDIASTTLLAAIDPIMHENLATSFEKAVSTSLSSSATLGEGVTTNVGVNTISLLPGLRSLRALQAELNAECKCSSADTDPVADSDGEGNRKKRNKSKNLRRLQSVAGSVTDGNRLKLDFNVDYGVSVQTVESSDASTAETPVSADVFTAAVTGVANALTSETAAEALASNLKDEV